MTQQTQKIEGKFYPLQEDEWIDLCKQLSPSEIKVLILLRTKSPFGTIQSLTVTEIAETLGINKSTVSRALKSLNMRGWIEFDIAKIANIRAVPKGFGTATGCDEETDETKSQPTGRNGNEVDETETKLTKSQQPTAENKSKKGFGQSLDKKKSKKKNTLSEEEREFQKWKKDKQFMAFCKRQADEMPSRVVLLDSWIQSNFEELLSIYKEAAGIGESSAATTPSKNSESTDIHPAIAKGLKDGSLIEYDRHNKMVKIKGEKWWTHVKDFLAMEEST